MSSEQDITGSEGVQRLLSQGKQNGSGHLRRDQRCPGNQAIISGPDEDVLQFLDDEGVQVINNSKELAGASLATRSCPVARNRRTATASFPGEDLVAMEGMPLDDSVRMWLTRDRPYAPSLP